MFAGTIKNVQFIENSYTHTKFYWMVVETLSGHLDIVCASGAFKRKPEIGNIVDGSFYLTGKFNLQEHKKPFLKNWLKKI